MAAPAPVAPAVPALTDAHKLDTRTRIVVHGDGTDAILNFNRNVYTSTLHGRGLGTKPLDTNPDISVVTEPAQNMYQGGGVVAPITRPKTIEEWNRVSYGVIVLQHNHVVLWYRATSGGLVKYIQLGCTNQDLGPAMPICVTHEFVCQHAECNILGVLGHSQYHVDCICVGPGGEWKRILFVFANAPSVYSTTTVDTAPTRNGVPLQRVMPVSPTIPTIDNDPKNDYTVPSTRRCWYIPQPPSDPSKWATVSYLTTVTDLPVTRCGQVKNYVTVDEYVPDMPVLNLDNVPGCRRLFLNQNYLPVNDGVVDLAQSVLHSMTK
jgi:hypothetical protein